MQDLRAPSVIERLLLHVRRNAARQEAEMQDAEKQDADEQDADKQGTQKQDAEKQDANEGETSASKPKKPNPVLLVTSVIVFIGVLAGICAVIHIFGLPKRHYTNTFNVEFSRYTDPHCSSLDTQIGASTIVRQGQCQSWPTEPSFYSWQYDWKPRFWGSVSELEGYGTCTIDFWKEDGCQGRHFGGDARASASDRFNRCCSFRNRTMMPRSTRIDCV